MVAVRIIIHYKILPLRKRAHPLWQHQGVTDPMMHLDYPISDQLLLWLMVLVVFLNFLGGGMGLAPFSARNPLPMDHPLTRMIQGLPLLLWG